MYKMIRSIFTIFALWTTASSASIPSEYYICGHQLSNYKHFMINLILSAEDVCERLKNLEMTENAIKSRLQADYFMDILRFTYNDLDFNLMLQNAVSEKCSQDLPQERISTQKKSATDKNPDSSAEKRNGVIIGKKQRFNPWGGKRSGPPAKVLLSEVLGNAHYPTLSDTTFLY